MLWVFIQFLQQGKTRSSTEDSNKAEVWELEGAASKQAKQGPLHCLDLQSTHTRTAPRQLL